MPNLYIHHCDLYAQFTIAIKIQSRSCATVCWLPSCCWLHDALSHYTVMAFCMKKKMTMITNIRSMVVLFSRDPPKVVHTPKTFALKKYLTNILCEEKHIHGIALALT